MRRLLITIVLLSALRANATSFAISSVTVLGSTTSGGTSACLTAGACSGWVIEIQTSNSVATGGTYSLGFSGTSWSPSAANIVLSCTSLGFTNTGTATTIIRTIYGTRQLRQPYSTYQTNDEFNDGATKMVLRIALSDVVYTADTCTATIAASIYTSSSNTTNSFSGSVTNSSSITYSTPKTIANWSRPGWQRITGSTLTLAVVAFQRHALNNLPVAAVVFSVQDAHSHVATVTISVPTIDPTQGDQSPVVEYVGNVSTATFTQSDLLTANFRVYPWVGDETTVMDSADATVVGSVTSGTCQANEQVKQATTNAIAYLDNIPLGTNAPSMIIGQIVSQSSTPTSSNIWTGQTSGCQVTPTAVPATVNPQPTPLAGPQYYINDPGNSYGTAVAVVDGSQNITGSVTSGVFVAGEKLTQTTSGAILYAINAPTGSTTFVVGQTVSGTPNSSNVWTGGTSGAVYTPTATPAANGSDSNSCAVAESTYTPGTTPGGGACATIHGGAVKMAAFNNANYTRNDVAGTMYLKQSYYNWTGASGTVSSTTGNVWATITPFSAVTKSQVVIDQASGAFSFGTRCTSGSTTCSTPIHLKGVTVNIATNPAAGVFDLISYLWLDNVSLTNNGNPTIYRVSQYYITQSQLPSVAGGLVPFSTSTSNGPTLLRGSDLSGTLGKINVYTMIGNYNGTINANLLMVNEISGGNQVASTQVILAFNRLYRLSTGSNSPFNFFATSGSILGAVFAQNVMENNNNSESVELLTLAGDTTTSTPISNVMIWDNVIAGGRLNYGYDDTGSTVVLRSSWSQVGNLIDSNAIKTDTFVTANAARVGNWAVVYGVGTRFNAVAQLSGGTTGWVPAGTYFPEFSGVSSYIPAWSATNANGTSTSNPINGGTNTTINFFSYNTRTAYDGTSANAGGGDYRVLSNSNVANLVTAGQGVLPYDLAGVIRDITGHGCGGAYECPTVPPGAFSW